MVGSSGPGSVSTTGGSSTTAGGSTTWSGNVSAAGGAANSGCGARGEQPPNQDMAMGRGAAEPGGPVDPGA